MTLGKFRRRMRFSRFRRHVTANRRLRLEALESRQLLYGVIDASSLLAAEGEDAAVPDFALEDTNSTSTTYQQEVSPRQFQQEVSAYYFGSAL